MTLQRILLLILCVLATGCATRHGPDAQEWLSYLGEEHRLILDAAGLCTTVFNEIHDRPLDELRSPEVIDEIEQKIDRARASYRRAQSWNLKGVPNPPVLHSRKEPTSVTMDLSPSHPLSVRYVYSGYVPWNCYIDTLRGTRVVSFSKPNEPYWNEPFDTWILEDEVDLDVFDMILRIPIR